MEAQPTNSVGPWYTSSSQGPPPPYQTSQQAEPTQYSQRPRQSQGGCGSGRSSCCNALIGIGSALLLLIGLAMGLWQLAQFIMNQTGKSNQTKILYPLVDGIFYNTTKGCDPKSRFQCPGQAGCIPYNWQCDGINDCYDNSDESRCYCKTATEYSCTAGGCYTNKQVCDKIGQCKATSKGTYDDELHCRTSCPTGEFFQCKSNARCIPLKLRCDGNNDCGDMSDETGCTCGPTLTSCANGLCVKLSKWCDGFRDCRDGSDELAGCHNSCPNNGMRCKSSGVCMSQAQLCDRIIDCLDESDEIGCNGCPAEHYKCSDRKCIPNAWLCDGVKDCSSGEDETHSSCPTCSSWEFQCTYERRYCIQQQQRCDGVFNCVDTSDERSCVALGGTGAGAKPLIVYQNGTSPNYVCVDNWSDSWSNFACSQMGFGSARTTSGASIPSSSSLLMTTSTTGATSGSLVQYLRRTGFCPSGQVVALQCEELGCGKRVVSGSSVGQYIVNGAPAARGAWPWQVLVLYDESVICGGSILNEQWILTAAHCAVEYADMSKIKVRAGSVLFDGVDPDAQVKSVNRVIVHSNYDDNNQRNVIINDLALLRLSTPLTYSETVRSICIREPPINLDEFKLCVASGFGRTRSDGSASKVLLQGRMEPMSKDTCKRAFFDLSKSKESWKAADSDFNYILCAGSYPAQTGIDICQGDSGGPLACQNQEGVWYLIGVSSFGFANCDLSVFVNVPAYSEIWIKNTMMQFG